MIHLGPYVSLDTLKLLREDLRHELEEEKQFLEKINPKYGEEDERREGIEKLEKDLNQINAEIEGREK